MTTRRCPCSYCNGTGRVRVDRPAYLDRFKSPVETSTEPEPHLSERARKVLDTLGITEPRAFANLDWLDLVKVRGCGAKTRAELLQWAGEHGAHLLVNLKKENTP